MLTEDQHIEIETEATKRFKEWNRPGVRGQMVMPQQFLDYWVAEVAYEKGHQDGWEKCYSDYQNEIITGTRDR